MTLDAARTLFALLIAVCPACAEPERPRHAQQSANPTDLAAHDRAPDSNRTVESVPAVWRCDSPGCRAKAWSGAVVTWPSWSAYASNGRAGDQSRTVYGPSGVPLHPYMGPWADGCEITVETGSVIVVEWKRGQETWRQKWLEPGQTHVIRLSPPEDGAMIEGYDGSPGFSVSLEHCSPMHLP